MPLVEGDTLRARLDRERQLPLGDVIRIATEVADARPSPISASRCSGNVVSTL